MKIILQPVEEKEGSLRVFRGGSWLIDAWYARVSSRDYFDPSYRGDGIGFRLTRNTK
jgi:formylglycine-generating enzyme required for sulfatase activity